LINSLPCIRIEDTGIGIPKSEKIRVYEEFYQLHNHERDHKNGLGLGLSIVRRLVPLLNAELSFVSTPGQGAQFTLSLPGLDSTLPKDKNVAIEKTSAANMSETTKMLAGLHVLIVDDDRAVRRSVRTLLESVDVEVSEASGTKAAINLALNQSPDVALIDLRLPKGDSGEQSVRELRKIQPDLPTIFISGEFDRDRVKNSGIDNYEYLVKPVDMPTLFVALERIVKIKGEIPETS